MDAKTGEHVASVVKDYAHGVMDRVLPDGITRLGADWVLQHPLDYLDVLEYTVHEALAQSALSRDDIIGLSVDFTASTILPIDASGVPLCAYEKYIHRPHSYVKLWKHHAAGKQTRQINELLKQRGVLDQPRYGGKVSSELFLPKVLQMLQEDPEIYAAADQILEAGDWITQLLTGEHRRSASTAAYKAMWNEEDGYPVDVFSALESRLEGITETKMRGDICPVGGKFGELNQVWAEKLGLLPGTAVGANVIDAHSGMPGCGITRPGQMMLIIGTSSVQAALSEEPYSGKGILGGVKNGIIPGYYALESGLAGVGDIFEWFLTTCLPAAYKDKAAAYGLNLFRYLSDLAGKYRPGESGLLALDWWTGNKTPFVDAGLSGLILGLTLGTKPEEVYRALVEATGFGTRMIMDQFEEAGVGISAIYACGGIAEKDDFLMQIYADITNREIKVSASGQTAALGAAMYASVAAGAERGGYNHIAEAAVAMSRIREHIYMPNPANVLLYERLYAHYQRLSAYFGGENDVMKELRSLRAGS